MKTWIRGLRKFSTVGSVGARGTPSRAAAEWGHTAGHHRGRSLGRLSEYPAQEAKKDGTGGCALPAPRSQESTGIREQGGVSQGLAGCQSPHTSFLHGGDIKDLKSRMKPQKAEMSVIRCQRDGRLSVEAVHTHSESELLKRSASILPVW